MESKLPRHSNRSAPLVCLVIGGLLFVFSSVACSYERAYEKTPVDQVSLKVIPKSRVLITEGQGNYFTQEDGLFMRLFRYIKANQVEMTTPVEASIDQASMVFYVGLKDSRKELQDRDQVQVVEKEARLVVALGARGGYTEENFKKTKVVLERWLKKQKNIQPTGEAYAVYWDGPYIPGAFKRFEVHIPVRALELLTGGKVVQDEVEGGPPAGEVSEMETTDHPELRGAGS